MLMNSKEANERLDSPNNLMNRLRVAGSNHKEAHVVTLPAEQNRAMAAKSVNQPLTIPPSSDNLVIDLEHKIKLAGLKNKAVDVLDSTLDELKDKVHLIDNVSKLVAIADSMARISNGAHGGDNARHLQQLVIWQPIMIQENHYETIQVSE